MVNETQSRWHHILFIFLVGWVLAPIVYEFNHNLFFVINGFANGAFSWPMLCMTTLVDATMVIILLSLLQPFRRKLLLPILATLCIGGLIVASIKYLYPTRRPLLVFGYAKVFFIGNKAVARGFPSGHSFTAMVFARFLMGNTTGLIRYAFLLVGIFGGLSRIYIGVHFPIDVWVGCFLGYLLSEIAILYHGRIEKRYEILERFEPWFVSLLGLIACVYYLFFSLEKTKELNFIFEPLVILITIILLARPFYYVIQNQRRERK